MADFLFSDGPIRALQQFSSPFLDGVFLLITMSGGGLALFALSVFVFWYVDRKVGFLITVAFLVSSALNELLKSALGMPRPPAAVQKTSAGGNGFPSGHAQQSSAVWFLAAFRLRGVWILLGAVAIPLVALSRVYLGVHYVGDVVGGVAIGLAVAACTDFASRKVPWAALSPPLQLVVAAVVPVAVLAVLAAAGQPASSSLGRLAGAATGFLLQEKWVRLSPPTGRVSVALRTIIGAPAFVALEVGASKTGNFPAAVAFEFLLGLMIFCVLPWVFLRVERYVAVRWRRPEMPTPPRT